MCYPVKCNSCGKTTWAGCGKHIESVKASVPDSEWCACNRQQAGAAANPGIIKRIFGR